MIDRYPKETETHFLAFNEVRIYLHILYKELGSWGKVSKVLELSKGTVHDIAVKGREPKGKEIRIKLGLPPVCQYCKQAPRIRKRITRIRDMKTEDLLRALENRKEM